MSGFFRSEVLLTQYQGCYPGHLYLSDACPPLCQGMSLWSGVNNQTGLGVRVER